MTDIKLMVDAARQLNQTWKRVVMVWKWLMFQTMCIMLCAKWMKP